MSTKLAERIEQYAGWFEYKERGDDDTIVILKDGAPEEIREAVYKAHGEIMPNDWVYSTFLGILEKLQEYTIEDLEDVDEYRPEIVDSLINVYTYALTRWLAEDISRVHYVTEALQNGGADDGIQLLMQAQALAIEGIFAEVYTLLEGANS